LLKFPHLLGARPHAVSCVFTGGKKKAQEDKWRGAALEGKMCKTSVFLPKGERKREGSSIKLMENDTCRWLVVDAVVQSWLAPGDSSNSSAIEVPTIASHDLIKSVKAPIIG
jgi:hypothetical protein